MLFLNEITDQYEAAYLQRTKPHPGEARKRLQRIKYALECVRKLVGDNTPPLILHARLLPIVHWDLADRVQLVCLLVSGNQPRQVDTTRQLSSKSRNSGGTLSIGQGFEASASFAVERQSTFLQGSVGSLRRPQRTVAPDTNHDYACLLAAHSSISQTQAHDSAVEKRIIALESQVCN